MDTDLQDLLTAWLDDKDFDEQRYAALLARLREDVAFRQTFIDEIRLLGMLKVVQSSEPRWLRLEDELGWLGRSIQSLARVAPELGAQLEDWRGRAAAIALRASCR